MAHWPADYVRQILNKTLVFLMLLEVVIAGGKLGVS